MDRNRASSIFFYFIFCGGSRQTNTDGVLVDPGFKTWEDFAVGPSFGAANPIGSTFVPPDSRPAEETIKAACRSGHGDTPPKRKQTEKWTDHARRVKKNEQKGEMGVEKTTRASAPPAMQETKKQQQQQVFCSQKLSPHICPYCYAK